MHLPSPDTRSSGGSANPAPLLRGTISIAQDGSEAFCSGSLVAMKDLPNETDFIVVGAGIAGLRASVELASAGRVLCLAKKEVTESNTQYAQGGIAAALSDDDEVSLHLDDTLKAGDGLCNADAARVLVGRRPCSH